MGYRIRQFVCRLLLVGCLGSMAVAGCTTETALDCVGTDGACLDGLLTPADGPAYPLKLVAIS